ncbi:MAG: FecR family protein [Flavobacteriaceae bacterium]|nr:FecR family protein [Flavobacteriaceae bacterium]
MEFKLIIKNLNKTLTPDEEIIFIKWYNESEKHKTYFENVKGNYRNGLSQIDIKKEWLALENKIIIPSRKTNLWKYIAAASVVLLISISFVFNFNKTPIIKSIAVDNNDIIENPIITGTDKAILTLEDGSNILLEKGGNYTTERLNSNGEELVYIKESNTKSEIKYNYLTIPRGGQFYVQLSDGTKVWLNSESQLKYPISFIEGETRIVELVYGEAYFEVSPSTNHNGSKFKVRTLLQEVEVLGTEFNIKAYKDETNIYTTLVEGKVIIDNGFASQNLIPHQQSNLNLKNNTMTISLVDVYRETSWKKGLFSFKSTNLKEIMKVLSRWYDVNVVFSNPEIENIKFNGVLSKNQTIKEILTTIKNTKFIKDYDITDKKITIY